MYHSCLLEVVHVGNINSRSHHITWQGPLPLVGAGVAGDAVAGVPVVQGRLGARRDITHYLVLYTTGVYYPIRCIPHPPSKPLGRSKYIHPKTTTRYQTLDLSPEYVVHTPPRGVIVPTRV